MAVGRKFGGLNRVVETVRRQGKKIKQKMCAKSVKFDFGRFGFIFAYSQVRSVILLEFADIKTANFKLV